ncbi:hypothetical protein GCM10010399_63900 [Dactylosporangium fulvum]|uniref:Uncharacterized protein n=1 Tax=Dactylosporangium fulvum TaxID=53359 RepID=A0ABY5W7C9_9ACTN|nr:hypothetical protein [Dactylosporangium fulvum]UWP85787.1 hypothetical protein Dfulv_16705 [Dactylosporangium fulvum]
MSGDIRVRWSADLGARQLSGEVTIPRIDWDRSRPAGRRLLVRAEVGDAVIRALGVDWTVTNARIDDPNR